MDGESADGKNKFNSSSLLVPQAQRSFIKDSQIFVDRGGDGRGYDSNNDLAGIVVTEERVNAIPIGPEQYGVSRPLQPLVFTRHIFLRLTDHFDNILETGLRSYEIFNTFGSRIYLASVFSSSTRNQHHGCLRYLNKNYEMYVWDHEGIPALHVTGSHGCCGQGAGMSVNLVDETQLGFINQAHRCGFLNYLVIDCDQPRSFTIQIKAPSRTCCGGIKKVDDFAIFSSSNKFVGRVSRDWDVLGVNFVQNNESSDACMNTYGMAVPIEMSPHLKSIILAFLILIDLQFYPGVKERQSLGQNRSYGFLLSFIFLGVLSVSVFLAIYLATQTTILRLE